ncbi:MAG: NAD(P)-binding protein [Thermodesulfobacteriota bacterium]|nr:NAD(P)-binding protein [Thermodesulfobacteriota bacterium]
MPEQIIFKREEDMPYLPITFGSMAWNKTGTWRYLRPKFENKISPCIEGCPAGQDIEGAMVLIGKGKILQAWDLFKEENPFPAVCGRVCFHPCESSCNRGEFDEAVSINALERFMADMASRHGRKPLGKREKRKEKAAIVGSGPAGLTCAYHLARLGYGVTVFEALPVLGGMLRVGIPEYRLPKKVLEEEIDQILELGVKAEVNVRLGKDFLMNDLKEYQAIFLAMGNHQSKSLGIPGEDTQGIMSGLEFLKNVNLGKAVALGKRVAVIGGGNTAIDAARSVLRLGSKPFILYRRTREEMPAFLGEILEAEEEGIEISYLVSPVRVIAENGKVSRLECLKNRLGPADEDGRRRPVEIKGSNFFLEVDQVIAAIGEEADLSPLPKKLGLKENAVLTDERGATRQKGVFAGGDIIQQPRTVVHAIGSGKRAAIFIDCFLKKKKWEGLFEAIRIGEQGTLSMKRYLQAENERASLSSKTVRLKDLNLDYFDYKKRKKMPKTQVAKRVGSFEEVNQGYAEETAVAEAKRCFNCGVCNLCDNCYIYCPDVAILKQGEDGPNVIDYDHCKGCGICVEECPRDAMVMEEERR